MKIIKQFLILFLLWVGGIYLSVGQVTISGGEISVVCSGDPATLTVNTGTPSSPSSCGNGSQNMSNGTTNLAPGSVKCFYDSGGPSGQYSNDESYTHTFRSTNGSPVYISFSSYSFGNALGGFFGSVDDRLYVYDGPNTSGTQLTASGSSGSGITRNYVYIAYSGSLTVKFTSNWTGRSSGWEAKVGCNAYNWSNGATTATIDVEPEANATYSVTVSGGFCSGSSSTSLSVVQCDASGCPGVAPAEFGTGLTEIERDCHNPTVTLSAHAVATAATANDYYVMSIPYRNIPFTYTEGTRIFAEAIDDSWNDPVSLPFDFCFYGGLYSQIVAGSNSVATFDYSVTPHVAGECDWQYSAPLPNGGLFKNAIYACYRDIYPDPGDFVEATGDGGIYEGVLGEYPCRCYKLSFNNIKLYRCTEVRTFSSMIVLYEGTNIIDVFLRDAPACGEWNSGSGCIGVQNSTGTAAVVPPNRNTGAWTAHEEAWRFVPTGVPNYTVTWYQGPDISGPVVGTGDVITVTPPGSTDYTARLQYTACNGDYFDLTGTCHVTVNTGAPDVTVTAEPEELCASAPTTLTANAPQAVSYQWSTGATTATTTATPTDNPTTYFVTVAYSNGCTNLGSVTVHLDQTPPVFSGSVGPANAAGTDCVFTVPDVAGLVRPNSSDDVTAREDLVITQSPTAGTAITGPTTVTVTITDACGNSTNTTVEVVIPDPPQLQLLEQQDVLCYGAATGSLSVEGSSGVPPYSFAWTAGDTTNSANGITGSSASSLQADSYTITLTDAVGCTATETYTLQNLSQPMVAGVLSPAQGICLGETPQTLSVTGSSGGNASYYVWQQSADGVTFTDIEGAGSGSSYTPGAIEETTCYRVAYTSDSCGVVYTDPLCITVGVAVRTELEDTICYGVPYTDNGFNIPATSLTTPGLHIDSLSLQTVLGCDSTVALQLMVRPPVTAMEEMSIGENFLPYTWNGVVFTEGGEQTVVLVDANGCDSTVTMLLHVLPNTTVYIDTTICDNALPLVWNDVTFTEAGSQPVVFPTDIGTDSTVYMTVYVVEPSFVTVRDGVCQNEPYSGYGFDLTAEETAEAGVLELTQLFPTALGCDSTVTLLLSVYPSYDQHYTVVACDSMVWNGQVYWQSGSYTQNLTTSHGCDSNVTKDVEVVNTALELVNYTSDFCEHYEAQLSVITQLEHIRWSTGEENVYNIVAHHSGPYTVTANTAHCEAFARLEIPTCEFNLYIPNAITPSRLDGNNDYFCLPEGSLSQIESFELRIYDRWGRVVFKSDDPHFRWDGRQNGKLMISTTYTYYIKLSLYAGGDYLYKGVITVL